MSSAGTLAIALIPAAHQKNEGIKTTDVEHERTRKSELRAIFFLRRPMRGVIKDAPSKCIELYLNTFGSPAVTFLSKSISAICLPEGEIPLEGRFLLLLPI
jgi:hypothetical protein